MIDIRMNRSALEACDGLHVFHGLLGGFLDGLGGIKGLSFAETCGSILVPDDDHGVEPSHLASGSRFRNVSCVNQPLDRFEAFRGG